MILPLVLLLVAAGAVSPLPSPQDLPMRFGFCKYPSATPNFNTERFFNNKWYVWKNIGNYFFKGHGSCAGMDTRMMGNDIKLLHFQYEPLINRYVTIRGDAEADYVKFEGLVFPVFYNVWGRYNFSVTFSILGTDYDNWAGVYYCHQLLGIKLEMSWVMTRDRQHSPTIEKQEEISQAVAQIGYKLDDYKTQDNSACGYDEPHL